MGWPPEPRFLMCCTGRPGEGACSSARLALGGGATRSREIVQARGIPGQAWRGAAQAGSEPAGSQGPVPPPRQPLVPSPFWGPDPGRAAAPATMAAATGPGFGPRLEARCHRARGRARGGKVQGPEPRRVHAGHRVHAEQPTLAPQPAHAAPPAHATPTPRAQAQLPTPAYERHPSRAGPRLRPSVVGAASRGGLYF